MGRWVADAWLNAGGLGGGGRESGYRWPGGCVEELVGWIAGAGAVVAG